MIIEKRGRWCARDEKGHLRKFKTKEEAETFLGLDDETEEDFDVSELDEWRDFDPDC